jgi:hypothetical protein
MKRSMKASTLIATIGALALSMLVARTASADTPSGYVCTTTFGPQTDYGYGKSGYLTFSVYSSPGCAGTFVGSFFAFTKGQTNTTLITDTRLYTEATLMRLDGDLTQALIFSKRIDVFNFPTATWLAAQVRFWAN